MSYISPQGEASTSSEIAMVAGLYNLAPSATGEFIRKTSLTTFENVAVGGGTADHAALLHLAYATSGHTGFQPAGSYLTSVGTGTINEITYWSGTNTLGSLATATYPSLTELAFLKGTSSAIQTQFTGKAATGQTFYIGTTQVAINRASAALVLTGITSIDGSSASTTGNAATATKLATARAINGVDFDGTAPITVTADANTLSNTTLKSTVVSSSLTSVGTLTGLTVNSATITLSQDTNFVLSGGVNGVSFNTNTLSIDATNGRVGIGTTSPQNLLTLSKLGSTYSEGGIDFFGTIGSPTTPYNTARIYTKFDGVTYATSRLTLAYPTGVDTWVDGLSLKNGNVGIGTTGPYSLLDVSSATGGILTLSRADISVTAGDVLGQINFWSSDTSTTTNPLAAQIQVTAKNTIATDINPGVMKFYTTPTGVAAALTLVLTLDETQAATFANIVNATTFVGALTGTASGNLVSGGALGTPSSGTLTSCTGLPVAGGGTGLATIADGSVLATNTADTLTAITWHAAGTKVLTNTSGTISWETAGAASVAWDDIGDPDADATIAFAGYEQIISSTLNEASHTTLNINNSTADITAAVTLLKLTFVDDGQANGTFFECLDNNSGDSKFSIGVNGNTLIVGTLGVTGAITGNVTGNCSGSAGTVANATFTTALTVNTGTLTLTAAAANNSVLTIGAGAVSVSGANTGDNTVATALTGTPSITVATVTTTGDIELGNAADTTISRTGAGAIAVEGVAVLLSGGALGTPASGTVTNLTGTMTNLTLVTPVLGTPQSGTLTNCTGYAADINLLKGKQINLTLPDTDATCTGNVTSSFNAGYASAIGDLVFYGSGGKWLEVDADAVATCVGLLGIALEAKTDGQAMKVALPGSMVHLDAWTWTTGNVLYAGETLGAMQNTIPTGVDAIVRVVGFAVDADTIFFNPSSDQQSTVA